MSAPPPARQSPRPSPGELVLISGRDPLRRAGGTESYLLAHAHAARRAGFEPHIFAVARRSQAYHANFGILHRVATPIRPVRSLTAAMQRPWLSRAVMGFLAGRPGPHIVHCYSSWGCIALDVCRRLAAQGIQAHAVTTFFTTAEHEAAGKLAGRAVRANLRFASELALEVGWVKAVNTPVERRIYHESEAVVVNYRSVRDLLVQAYGERDGVHLLPYAAPTAFAPDGPARTTRERAEGELPLIVSVARHDGRKGLDVLIRALAGLRDGGVRFRACLVGTGMLLEAHRRLVRSLRLEGQVALPGRVPDVVPYLRGCDVFVLASTEEGSGSVAVLEALQAGAPIVSTSVDGIPEDLTHERDALLVAPGSVDELRDALRRMLADDTLRERLGVAARASYERRFAPEVAARSLGTFYASLGLMPSVMKPA